MKQSFLTISAGGTVNLPNGVILFWETWQIKINYVSVSKHIRFKLSCTILHSVM